MEAHRQELYGPADIEIGSESHSPTASTSMSRLRVSGRLGSNRLIDK